MHRLRRKRSGFVLLMALLVLAVAGTLLAASARYSSARALQAGAAMEELQVRWGTISCQAVCLPQAEQLLSAADVREAITPVTIRRTVELGGVNFQLVVSDEQSKANANALARKYGIDLIAPHLERLQSSLRRPLQIILRPNEGIRPYASFEQLFAFEHPSQLILPDPHEESPVSSVTCWGTGLINFKRAQLPVIRQGLAGLLDEGQLRKLMEFRSAQPDCTLEEAIKHLQFDDKKAQAARAAMTDSSRCHSLWVIAQGRTRAFYRLYVGYPGTGGGSAVGSFAW